MCGGGIWGEEREKEHGIEKDRVTETKKKRHQLSSGYRKDRVSE